MTFLCIQRWAFCLTLAVSANWVLANPQASLGATIYGYEIIAERSHKNTLFTQGLVLDGGHFYESSGLYKQSLLVRYPVEEPKGTWAKMSARFSQQVALPPQYFAEGLALFNNKLYLLTWREQTLMIYNRKTFTLEKTLRYTGQGWGLTNDDKHLIRSDGSHRLYFHEPENFKVVRTLEVSRDMAAVERLNELEYIKGKVWANIWHENHLVEIDPATGQVVGFLDLTDLVESLTLTNSEQVLNGIAYDAEQDALWVTGKLWPKMFLIKLIER